MLVPVVVVLGVAVAIMNVIHVIAVLHSLVTTVRAMLMVVVLVNGMAFRLTLVPVAVVLAVDVTIVCVVGVVAVLEALVAAVWAVLVVVVFVLDVRHAEILLWGSHGHAVTAWPSCLRGGNNIRATSQISLSFCVRFLS